MKSFDTDFQKYVEKINLKHAERADLRERILSYMEYHPLPKQSTQDARVPVGILSDSFITIHFNTLYMRVFGGVIVLLLVIAPFAAERAVPGDALYLVKTGVNENVQKQLATTPYEKIEFETKLMERRITEARILANEGKLTDEVKTQIAETVKGHTEAVQNNLIALKAQDADSAAIAEIAFNSSLEVQSAVLEDATQKDAASSVDSILDVVNEAHDAVASNQTKNTPSFESLVAQVELETTRAHELFETIKKTATKEEVTDIERRMSDTERLFAEAKTSHEKGVASASDDMTNTLASLQKLITFMSDMHVRESVSLDTIVPIVLSDTERISAVKELIRTTQATESTLKQKMPAIDADVMAKVRDGLVAYDAQILRTQVALDAQDIDVAEKNIHDAKILIDDLDKITAPYEAVETEKPVPETEHTDTGSTTSSADEVIEHTEE